MSNLVITKGYADGAVLTKSLLDTSFNDVSTWLNNRDNGSDNWLTVFVSATVAIPVSITSSAATTTIKINNTATDGDPKISFQLSGAEKIGCYIDDSDSDMFKFDDAGGTRLLVRTDSTGGISVGDGSAAMPGITFLGSTSKQTGFYKISGSDQIGVGIFGTGQIKFTDGTIEPITDNDVSIGTASKKWSDVRSYLINGADIGFANGWVLREWPCAPEEIYSSDEWMKAHANKGIQVINDAKEVVAIIERDGTIKAKKFEIVESF